MKVRDSFSLFSLSRGSSRCDVFYFLVQLQIRPSSLLCANFRFNQTMNLGNFIFVVKKWLQYCGSVTVKCGYLKTVNNSNNQFKINGYYLERFSVWRLYNVLVRSQRSKVWTDFFELVTQTRPWLWTLQRHNNGLISKTLIKLSYLFLRSINVVIVLCIYLKPFHASAI